jgi:filamentous hemagglutinin
VNRNCFHLIFSKKLGFLIPVAEIVTSHRKSGPTQGSATVIIGATERNSPCPPIALMSALTTAMMWSRRRVLMVTLMIPGIASAQIVVDPHAPSSNQANLSQSANGVTVIEIANPNGSGLSHNKFQDFDVSRPGVIYNNSKVDGVSQIGGYVMNNPKLAQNATAILTEVTGVNPSHIAGTLEVFGRGADVLIANPNGVTLNGVNTINANSLTVTTGKVLAAPGALQFTVDDKSGRVIVGAGGMDTQGLSYFDIVARGVDLQGAVGSASQNTDIHALAGLNTYDVNTRSHVTNSNTATNTPSVAIEGGLAGAMYGRNISLVSTESGAGVRHAGLIKAAQDISIDANGNVAVAQLQAGRGVGLHSSGSVDIGTGSVGDGINAGGAVNLQSRNGMTIRNTVSGDTLTLTAKDLLIQAAHLVAKSTTMPGTLKAVSIKVGNFTLTGELIAYNLDGSAVSHGEPVVLKDGKIQVQRANNTWDTNFYLVSSGMILSGDGIDIDADTFSNFNGILSDTGNNGSSLRSQTVNNQGLFNTAGNLQLVAEVLNNLCTAGTTAGGASQSICAGFSANGSGALDVGKMNNKAGLVAKQDMVVTLGAGEQINSSGGSIGGGASLKLTQALGKKVHLKNTGEIVSGGDLLVILDALSNLDKGRIVVGHNAKLDVTASLINANQIEAGNTLQMTATDIVNGTSATVNARDLSIDAKNLVENQSGSNLNASSNLYMHAGTTLSNAGSVFATDTVVINSDGELVNAEGSIVSGRILEVTGDNINNERNSSLYAVEKVKLTSRNDVINSVDSIIASDGAINIKADGDIVNDHSLITATNIVLDGANVVNRNGSTIVAIDGIAIEAAQSARNETGANIEGVTIDISAQGDLVNDNAKLTAERVRLAGGHVANSNKGVINAGIIAITSTGDVVNSGGAALVATSGISIAAHDSIINTGANIIAPIVSLEGKQVRNLSGAKVIADDIDVSAEERFESTDGGSLEASNNLSIDTAEFRNDGGKLHAGNHIEINATDFDNSNSGPTAGPDAQQTSEIVSNKTATISMKDGRDLHLTGGRIQAGELLSLNAHDVDVSMELNNPGKIHINATNDVVIDGAIITGNDLRIDAGHNVDNLADSLIWAARDIYIDARGSITNWRNAVVMAMRDLSLEAANVKNFAGRLVAGQDLWIDANSIVNEGAVTGGITVGGTELNNYHHKWDHTARYTEIWVDVDLSLLGSELSIEQAVIQSGRTLQINQRRMHGAKGSVLNQDGLMVSAGDININGDLSIIGASKLLPKERNCPISSKRPKIGRPKLAIIIETGSLSELEIGECFRRKGIFPEQVTDWHNASIASSTKQSTAKTATSGQSRDDKNQIFELE